MTSRQWVLEPALESGPIASEFKLHPVIAQILVRRGFTGSEETERFLNPSLQSLQSPFEFRDMPKAVERIRRAIAQKEKVVVYGDYDVDGITGSAILYPTLKKMGANIEAFIPHRVNDGYGLNRQSLENLLGKGLRLLITVDNGIAGADLIDFLNKEGVDTIIVDHHQPKGRLPEAYAIVSAVAGNQGDPNLAACGLAFKLAWALWGDFERVRDALDLVTVGTVADLAPVTGDNRILLKHGLAALAGTCRPGLRALIDVAGISQNRLNFRDIAFGLGPRINAAGRMGSPENAFKILTTDNPDQARELAEILNRGNRDRQRVESQAYEEAVERMEKEFVQDAQAVIVLESPDWHEGVLGIVASRLVERFRKPSIIISLKEEMGKGSGRSTPGFSLFEWVLECEDLLMNFGGHAQACGLTIRRENIPLFRQRLNQVIRQGVPRTPPDDLRIEAELLLEDLSASFLRDLDRLAPFGPGNQKPLFLSRCLKFKGQPKRRGKNTLEGWVTDAGGRVTCQTIGFRMFDRWESSSQIEPVDTVYQPSFRDYQGIRSIQLELEDWRMTT